MRYQAQSFIKQVQVDLLALSDADLLRTVDHWVSGKKPSGISYGVPEVTRSALGYTYTPVKVEHLSQPSGIMPGVEPETQSQWIAPSPPELRKLLAEMDVKQFAEHVITIAFQSLHATYPEWGDGSTFNAHLANHLRFMLVKRRRHNLLVDL